MGSIAKQSGRPHGSDGSGASGISKNKISEIRKRAAQAANLSLICSPPRAARQGHHNATIPESRCHGSTEALKTRCDTPLAAAVAQRFKISIETFSLNSGMPVTAAVP